jgi:hypothetical protein
MSNLVPTEDIERIVGATRHQHLHYGRAVSAEQTVYVLHSHECRDSGIDLRDCPFSLALDRGIRTATWNGWEDTPVELLIAGSGRLMPLKRVPVGEEQHG